MPRVLFSLLVLFVTALTVCGCGSPAPSAPTTVASGAIRRTLVRRAPAHEAGWETRLYLIEYPPGASAPVHVHPATGVGWVIEGEFESVFDGEPPVRVPAGAGFVDPANVTHRSFRNVSSEHQLRFVIAYTMRVEDEAVLAVSPR